MKVIPTRPWRSALFRMLALCLLAGGSQRLQSTARAADAPPPAAKASSLPADEEKAWAEVQSAGQPQPAPAAWEQQRPSREEFQAFLNKQADAMSLAADQAKEFTTRFPKSAHLAQARQLQARALFNAVAMGKKERQDELNRLVTTLASDPTVPEDDRVDLRLQKLRMDASQAAESSPDEAKRRFIDGLGALKKDFPKSEKVYGMLLALAMSEEGEAQKKLAQEVASSAGAPAKLKKRAQDLLDGKLFQAANAVGKPVDIQFKAVDGRAVDLAQLKGKVVLVDFWATWCGPCVAELPHVQAAYDKYHGQGFEIIGISFDEDKAKLEKFTQDKGMSWPQYFDGKGWENEFGQQFNIRAIPAMWLIDKQGNLADANARDDLAGKVAKLLEAK